MIKPHTYVEHINYGKSHNLTILYSYSYSYNSIYHLYFKDERKSIGFSTT